MNSHTNLYSREKHASVCLVLSLFLALPSEYSSQVSVINVNTMMLTSILFFLPFLFSFLPSSLPQSLLPFLSPSLFLFFLLYFIYLERKNSISSGRMNYFSCLSKLCLDLCVLCPFWHVRHCYSHLGFLVHFMQLFLLSFCCFSERPS